MQVCRAAVIGGGVIGAGWVARLTANGIDVAVHDPAPDAPRRMQATLENAGRAQAKLIGAIRPATGRVTWCGTIAEAVAGAQWIVEAVPERLDLKREVYAAIEAAADDAAIIASSTSGILPSDLQARMRQPGRLIVAHPFNPVYLLPLVEVVGGRLTAPASVDAALDFLAGLGMKPLHVRKEIAAFIADRLLEAVWRESLWLVKDGVCTTGELDDAIRFGFGLRWAQMGLFETYRIAGGAAGMRHFIAQFGPCLAWPWSRLTDVPVLDDALVELIVSQSDAQSGARSVADLERTRDDNLVAILLALKANDWGAGRVLADHAKRLVDAVARATPNPDVSGPIATTARRVAADWTDYNGHMNEARYLQCFGDATDAFLSMIGVDAAYVATGRSYFTVETHIRHLSEVRALEPIRTTTQVLAQQGKRLRLFHSLLHEDGRLLATGEHMLVHVSLETRTASDPAPDVLRRIEAIAQVHASLPVPEGAGRAVGQPR